MLDLSFLDLHRYLQCCPVIKKLLFCILHGLAYKAKKALYDMLKNILITL